MKFLKKYFFLLLIVCVSFANDQLRAQIYPVQISTQLVPPYSGYLPDYADPTAEKLKVILQFNDFTQAQYNIKLRFEIKGNGFTISTKTFYNPPPITLLPGQPLLLSGADLAPYLNSNNLDFIGINQSQYQQRMALPEGYYSICVKAYDYYNTNPIQISNEACAQAWFTLSDPPYLNLPFCGTAITPLTPQNILFQWTPVNMASPNSAFNTEYVFELFECRPDSNANPNQVVLSTAPIFSTTTQQTFLNYGIAEPPLNLYMKYIWRVRAKDITGRDLFKNNGYSQICTFTNGTIKNIFGNTLALTLTARAINHRNGECTFTKQSVYSNYMLQVRKQNTNYWFNFPNTSGIERIPNLEPNTIYECRVRGEAGTLIGDWSNTEIFKTAGPPVYSCNDNTQPVNVAQQPLPPSKAVVGLVIQSGQFEVVTTQIQTTGQPGWYKGKGYALVFGSLPVAVQWTNIYIDSEQRQQQGVIEAMTKGVNKWLNEWDIKEAEENATYVEGELDSVYVNGNQICYSLQGNSTPICVPTPTGVNVVVIRDSEGNQYNIQLNPPPPKVTGPFNYLNFSDDQLEASDNLKVVFEADENQNFGFDKKEYAAFIDNYEVIKLANGNLPAGQAGNYFVPNKSIGESASDIVVASYTLTGYTTSQLSFKTKSGTSINKIANGNKFKLTGIPSNAGCIYAYADNKKIGKLNIISLKAISKKLVIVPVNNASTNLTASQLNNIYKQANVSWSITTATNFTFNLGSDGLEAADATLLSKYSSEMRALRDAYKTEHSDYDKDAYYVFVVSSFSNENLRGYMVRGRALGFVKTGATPKEFAHELAHGAFGLEHTFPEAKEATTSNLLDYGNGIGLVKSQWFDIKNGGFICSWLDSEEDGSLNKDCHAGLTPSGRIFDECFDENGNKLNVVKRITQGNYCITSINYKDETYKWDAKLGFYVHKESQKTINVVAKNKQLENDKKVNVFRINAPGCSYQSASIYWSVLDAQGGNIQEKIQSKLTDNTLWDTDLFSGVKTGDCGTNEEGGLQNCHTFPQNMETVDVNYLVNNFFAFSPTSCLSTLVLKKRIELLRTMLKSWAVTECVQSINPNIPKIGNCYEPLVYKLILSTPTSNEKELLDSLVTQNLIYSLLDKTQYQTFDEVAKRLALWQIKYYPLTGENAILDKINGNIKAVEFLENKVSGSINSSGLAIRREAYGFCKECTPVSESSIQVPFMSYVLINFKDKVDVFNAGTKARMPAIYALYLFNKDRRELLETSGKLLFDIAMLAVGVGEIKAAYDAYKAGKTAYQVYIGIKALTDVGMSLGDMVVNNVLATSWKDTEAGRARLERWNRISMYWAIGSISSSALDNALKKYCDPGTKAAISESKFDELADELEEVVKSSGKFSSLIISSENGFIDMLPSLLSKEGLTLDDFHYMMQKSVNALTEVEKTKMANIRNAIPMPTSSTLMQKVITKDAIANYIKETDPYTTVGGYVTRAVDAKHLKSYDDIYYGLRLDYLNDEGKLINFIEDGSCGVIRFKSNHSSYVTIPGPDLLASNPYPFTAHGFTSGKMSRVGAPEFKFNGYKEMEEAEIWEVFHDGSEKLVAEYDKVLKRFIKK